MPRNESRIKAAVAIGVAVALHGAAWFFIEGVLPIIEAVFGKLQRLANLIGIADFGITEYWSPWWSIAVFLAIGALYSVVALAVATRVFKREA